MPETKVLQIVVFRGGSVLGTEVFMPGEYVVGSDAACDLALEGLAPEHLMLAFDGSTPALTDLSGGLAVNGQGVPQATLRSLDDVTVGEYLFKFRVMGHRRPAPCGAGRPGQPAPRPEPQPAAALVLPDEPEADVDNTPTEEVPAVPLALVPVRPPAGPAVAVPAAAASLSSGGPVTQPMASETARMPAPAPARPVAPPAPGPRAASTPAPLAPAVAKPVAAAGARPSPVASAPVAAPIKAPQPAVAPAAPRGSPPLQAVGPAAPRATAPQPVAPVAPRLASTPPAGAAAPTTATGPAPAPAAAPPARPAAAAAAKAPRSEAPTEPYLRVHVYWGSTAVAIHGFAAARGTVSAGPDETCDVPAYGLALPAPAYQIARFERGRWFARLPASCQAFVRESAGGWRPAVTATADGAERLIEVAVGQCLRFGDAAFSVELRAEPPSPPLPRAPNFGFDRQVVIPLITAAAIIVTAIALIPVPADQPAAELTAKQLAPIRALLEPPAEKPRKKKPEKVKEEKVVEPQKVDETARSAPKSAAQQVSDGVKAVQKIASGGAVQNLLKATAKITGGGMKGWGDKGMGVKISPLFGKPPVAMAGLGVGQGLGGFGTETKGIGQVRGMGNGTGLGAFAAHGTGNRAVAGTVVSAPAHKAKVQGSLDRELVAKVINDHIGEVRGCYERALLRDPGLAGKLELEWTIDTSGHVSDIRTKAVTLKGPDVPNCIVASLRGWAFPAPKGGVVIVSYPFLFNSVGF